VRWSSAFGSVFELHPARGVRPDARYYREGNALLDHLTAVIEGRRPTGGELVTRRRDLRG